MNYRKVKETDLSFFLSVTEELAKKSNYAPLTFDKEKMITNFFTLLSSDEREIFGIISESNGKSNGIIVLQKSDLHFTSESMAIELFFWTDGNPKAFLMLSRAAEEWARLVGAKFLTLGIVNKFRRLSKLYNRLGFKETETVFMKELI